VHAMHWQRTAEHNNVHKAPAHPLCGMPYAYCLLLHIHLAMFVIDVHIHHQQRLLVNHTKATHRLCMYETSNIKVLHT
jgi:hypothetical protein